MSPTTISAPYSDGGFRIDKVEGSQHTTSKHSTLEGSIISPK